MLSDPLPDYVQSVLHDDYNEMMMARSELAEKHGFTTDAVMWKHPLILANAFLGVFVEGWPCASGMSFAQGRKLWAKHLAPEEQTAAPAAPPVTAPAAAPASTPHVAPAAADAAPEDNGQSKKSGLPSSNFIMQQASIIASQAGTALSYGRACATSSHC